jgi:hypothetical protein
LRQCYHRCTSSTTLSSGNLVRSGVEASTPPRFRPDFAMVMHTSIVQFLHPRRCVWGGEEVTPSCAQVYGPQQFPEKLIPKFALLASRLEPLPIHGDGEEMHPFGKQSQASAMPAQTCQPHSQCRLPLRQQDSDCPAALRYVSHSKSHLRYVSALWSESIWE